LNKILIVRLGSLGDIVHALPAAAALRAAFPRSRIDWVVDRRHKDLLDLVPAVDRRFVVGEQSVLQSVKQLRQEHYDVAIDLQGLMKSAVLARGSGAARVVGFSAPHLREPLARFFYTEPHDPRANRSGHHVVDKNVGLIEAMGVAVPAGPPVFPLERPRSPAPDQVRSILGIGPADRFAVINPGAAWPNKRWPHDRFGSLARLIKERHNVRSVVLWGPGEESLAGAVQENSSGAARVAPATSIGDLVAVLGDAALVISGDTGPLHIAAAVGAPIVGIYGPTDPARNGPWADDDESVSRFEFCQCHHQRKCHARQWCLEDVSVDEVMRAVDRRMGKLRAHG
jgi:lipopolysaccharide heptosyltransferase I